MHVHIALPFRIELDIVGIEQRFPSLEIAVSIVEDRGSGGMSYRDVVWVEQGVWSAFLETLESTSFISLRQRVVEIAFGDVDQAFHFGISSREDAVLLRASFGFRRLLRRASFEIAADLDDDAFGHIQRAFAACPIR